MKNNFHLSLMLAIQAAKREGFTNYADALAAILRREMGNKSL